MCPAMAIAPCLCMLSADAPAAGRGAATAGRKLTRGESRSLKSSSRRSVASVIVLSRPARAPLGLASSARLTGLGRLGLACCC